MRHNPGFVLTSVELRCDLDVGRALDGGHLAEVERCDDFRFLCDGRRHLNHLLQRVVLLERLSE